MNAPEPQLRRQNRWGEGELLSAEILHAARRVLERDGSEAMLSLRGVAREAGISAPSIYAHFRDRNAMIEAVIASIWADYVATQNAALDVVDGASPRELLRAGIAAHIDFAHNSPASAELLWTRSNPSAVAAVGDAAIAAHQQMIAALDAARPGLTTAELRDRGQLLWATVHGLAALPPHHPRFPWTRIDSLIDAMLDLYA